MNTPSPRNLQMPSPAATMTTAIEAFYRRCKAKNLSPRTITFYRYRLEAFQRFLAAHYGDVAPCDVTADLIRAFISDEVERVSAATAEDSFVTLRAMYRYLFNERHIPINPTDNVERPKQKRAVITTFSLSQVEAMLTTCKSGFTGARNRAIIFTLIDCGLRVSELCTLRLDDINWTEQTMVVIGKGNKERIVPFGRSTRAALLMYFERRSDIPSTAAFFLTCYGDPLTRHGVLRALKYVGQQAKISGVRISPHTFRHTCAVMYLRNGGDVFSLQKLLGHSDLSMTRRYAELSQTDVVDKHRRFSPADAIKAPHHAGATRLK